MALTPCRGCKNPVAQSADKCPKCGAEHPAMQKGGYAAFQIVVWVLSIGLVWWVWTNWDEILEYLNSL